jgi:hypothetical protein
MSRLIAVALTWIARKLGLLLVIIGVLLAASWLKSEWGRHAATAREIATQESLLEGLESDLAAIDASIEAESRAWRETLEIATRALRAELASVDARIAAGGQRALEAQRTLAALTRDAGTARAAARQARAEFVQRRRNSWWWDKYVNPGKLVAVERARAKALALEATAETADAARRQAAAAAAMLRRQSDALHARRAQLLEGIQLPARSVSPRQAELDESRARKKREIESVEALLSAQRERAARDPRERLIASVRARLPAALGILVGILLLPVILKVILYFCVAPLAGRLPPIRILANDGAPQIAPPPPSGVSVPLEIAPGDELLVQPDFLQSSSQPARKRTKWFLNPRLPFASLASGMFALTSVVSEAGRTTRVVVSSQKDVLGEVGAIGIPAGAAMVVHPRALAGLVKPAGQPVDITRHWRLGSVHAWITLQLRYLVFHGPCRLILKGCRGVRSEDPQPDQPRMINQAATLAFSANLDYRTTRSETFVPYLRGQAGLFDDLFCGGPGRFVYEEVPSREHRAGITGRGLEGVMDAVLKAFGI